MAVLRRHLSSLGVVMEPTKCGTTLIVEAQLRRNELSPQARAELVLAAQRPARDTTRLSPSGRFRVHYDTTGINTPTMLAGNPLAPVPGSREEYVDSVISILDNCWTQEVVVLGYEPPPPDTSGGGPEYDVYLESLGSGEFGFTWYPGELQYEGGQKERYSSYIVLDNDFLGLRTPGLNGLRVTAAHEFHHAIQIGAYGIWTIVPGSDFYFYEATSVWMEDVLYTEVNDYLFDLPRYFQQFKAGKISYSFSGGAGGPGYERSVWAHYLAKRFGTDVMREIWTGMKKVPALRSMDVVLRNHSNTLRNAYHEFCVWNYFTGSRANPTLYYPEGASYPTLTPNDTITFQGLSSTLRVQAHPLSGQYYFFFSAADTIVAVLTNTDADGAVQSSGALTSVDLTLTTGNPPGAIQVLANGLKMGFLTFNPGEWRTLYLSSSSRADLRNQKYPSPNPLELARAAFLTLPADDSAPGTGEVFVLSASFDLVFSQSYAITDALGKRVVLIPTRDFASHVSSGVHFVVLKTREKEYQWKVVFVR